MRDNTVTSIPKQVLVVDIGGTALKILVTGESDVRAVASGVALTPHFGGGNAKLMSKQPLAGVRLGHNRTAFRGGARLWEVDDIDTLQIGGERSRRAPPWRMI